MNVVIPNQVRCGWYRAFFKFKKQQHQRAHKSATFSEFNYCQLHWSFNSDL